MSVQESSAIAHHVTAAKRLLDELERQAATALDAMNGENSESFLAAIDERSRIIAELNEVVATMAHLQPIDVQSDVDATLLDEMAHAASAALESQGRLMASTQAERDRLAAALDRAKRPDQIANQYAVATNGPRTATLSVTG